MMLDLFVNVFILKISWIIILTSIALLTWLYLQEIFSYWQRRGLAYIDPLKSSLATLNFFLGRKSFLEILDGHYRALEGHKYGGFYHLLTPSIFLRDPEAAKIVLVKGFPNFHDRNLEPDEESDKLSGSLFQLTGEKWRAVRHRISPAFSSAKLKSMHRALIGCARDLNAYLYGQCSETGATELDIKELMNNYTLDVIGACAMGIKCNAIQDPNCEFKRIVQMMFRFDWRRTIFQLLEQIHPSLPRLFRLKAVVPEVEEFLQTVIRKAIKMKEEEGSSDRKDFLQILMDIRRSELEKMNKCSEVGYPEAADEEQGSPEDEDEGPLFTEYILIGIMASFLSAGFEPVSATLSFCLYELAMNPKVQENMFNEIQTMKNQFKGDMNYENVKKYLYTEQVINETLRKYPIAGILSRICTEPFKIPDSNAVLEKGMELLIPVYSLHHDPRYFSEPDKFDLDRFSAENINKIVSGSYLPFGDGPRFCIAERLAMMDVKTMVIMLLSNYSIHPCTSTPRQLEFDKSMFSLSPSGGLWLRIEERK